MKRHLLITLLLTATANCLLFSQDPVVQWQNSIGGSGNDYLVSSEQTADGGYILGGYSKSGIGGDKTEANWVGGTFGYDYWIIKTDASGNIEWQNTIGGTGDDYLVKVMQALDGGYLVGGYSNSWLSGDKTEVSMGLYDYWVVKLDALGNISWQNTIGGALEDKLTDIYRNSTGGYVLAGYSKSGISGDKTEASMGVYDYWVVKINSLGTVQWQNTIGGSGDDYLRGIQKTIDGGYVLGGFSLSGISGDKTEATNGGYDYWAVKIDALGNIVWQNTIGGETSDRLTNITVNTDGSIVLLGHSLSEALNDKSEFSVETGGWDEYLYYDLWVVKLDNSGNILWDNTINSGSGEYGSVLQPLADGGNMVGFYGSTGGQEIIPGVSYRYAYRAMKLDANGYITWQNALYGEYTTVGVNDSSNLRSIALTSDGGYLFAGYSNAKIGYDKTENAVGGFDYWIVKLGPDTCTTQPVYADYDNDGYGGIEVAAACEFPLGPFAETTGDCDDQHSNVGPLTPEYCDGIDNDCDGLIDEIGCPAVALIEWDAAMGGETAHDGYPYGDDYLKAIIQTPDGGYIAGGYTDAEITGDKTDAAYGDNDYWVVKTDATGNIEWENGFGGADDDEVVAVDNAVGGGYFIAGESESGISAIKTEALIGSQDVWVIKLDNSGNIIWQNTIGSTSLEYVGDMVATADGGCLIAAYTSGSVSGDKTEAAVGSTDIWMIKLNSAGTIIWQNTIGSTLYDNVLDIEPLTGGGFALIGKSIGGISGDKTSATFGSYDYWLIGIDDAGNIIWQNVFGGSLEEIGYSVRQSADGGFIIGGTSLSVISGNKTEGLVGNRDIWVLKLDASRNIIWQNDIGTTSTEDQYTDALPTPDGGCMIAGSSDVEEINGDKTEPNILAQFLPYQIEDDLYYWTDDYWLLKLDASGNIVWQNVIGGNFADDLYAISPTTDGGYVLGGASSSDIVGDKTDAGFSRITRYYHDADTPKDDSYYYYEKDFDYWIVKLAGECVASEEICNIVDDDCDGLIDEGLEPDITITPAGATTFCQGGSVTLNATHTGTSLQWKKDGANIAGATNASYVANKKGNYTCVSTAPCGVTESTVINVTVNKNPNASITAGGATTFCAGGSVTLTEVAVAGSTYQWYKGASAIAGATTTSYVATTAGNYKCRVTKTATGCFKNSNVIMVTVPCKEGESAIITVYPNPATDHIIISTNSDEMKTIQLIDALGQVVDEKTTSENDVLFNIDMLAPGVYIIKLSQNNLIRIENFIKQ